MNENFEFNEYNSLNFGDNEYSDTSSNEVSQEEMVDDNNSDNSTDYVSYFEDIVNDLEELIGYADQDVTISDLHKDITITNFLILFFIVLFAGNKLINRIRGL